jgi:nucleoid-associated protein
MVIELVHTIIHGFEKETNTTEVGKIEKKSRTLDNSLGPVKALVEGVVNLIGKPGNTVIPGQFNNDQRQGKFPDEFDTFSQKCPIDNDYENYKELTEAEFIKLSHVALDELVKEASKQSFSTGGHILASCYKVENNLFLLIAMIKQRGGVSLNKDLVPIEVTEIDLSKVHQAVKINFSKYIEAAGEKIDDEEDDDNEVDIDDQDSESKQDVTYLYFLGTGRNTEASGYFVSALGCTKGVKSSRATNNAITAIINFFTTDTLKQYKRRAKDDVIAYLKRKCLAKEPAQLSEIVQTAAAAVPAEAQASVEGLLAFMNDDKNKVPSEFAVHKQTLKKRSTIKGDEDGWLIQFDQSKLGINPNSTIYFNREKKTLTINALSDKFISAIEEALNA